MHLDDEGVLGNEGVAPQSLRRCRSHVPPLKRLLEASEAPRLCDYGAVSVIKNQEKNKATAEKKNRIIKKQTRQREKNKRKTKKTAC